MKNGLKKKFGKRKEKKTKPVPATLSAQAAQQPTIPLPALACVLSLFSFSLLSLTPEPHSSASPSPPFPFLLLPCPAGRRRSRGFRRAPPLPLPFFPHQACQLSQLTALDQLGPFPLSLHRAVMAATINGRRRRPGSFCLPSPPFLWPYFSSRTHPCAPLSPLQRTHAHAGHQFRSAAASAPSRRRASAAVGEVHRRLALFFPVHDHGPHVMLVDQGKLPQETSRAWSLGPRLPERRSSRRRRRTLSLPLSLRP
jgi:hypothetical protein